MSLLTLTIHIDGDQAYARGPDTDIELAPGRAMLLIPITDVLCQGIYDYTNGLHLWRSSHARYVGLVNGMRVQVEVPA